MCLMPLEAAQTGKSHQVTMLNTGSSPANSLALEIYMIY
jgi:hypothetical protein